MVESRPMGSSAGVLAADFEVAGPFWIREELYPISIAFLFFSPVPVQSSDSRSRMSGSSRSACWI